MIPTEDLKTKTVKVLFSPREKAAFQTAAAAEGMKVSTWLRQLGRRASGLNEVRV